MPGAKESPPTSFTDTLPRYKDESEYGSYKSSIIRSIKAISQHYLAKIIGK